MKFLRRGAQDGIVDVARIAKAVCIAFVLNVACAGLRTVNVKCVLIVYANALLVN